MSRVQKPLVTSLGTLYLVASEKGLQGVFWKRLAGVPVAAKSGGASPQARILARAARQLEEYLSGKRKKFDLPFDVEGTPFQKTVWKALASIPYGRTCSYKDIAARIGKPKAVRAVGNANGKNPVCIVVPCHRVIAHGGGIGGYSGGLKFKKNLLALESAGVRGS